MWTLQRAMKCKKALGRNWALISRITSAYFDVDPNVVVNFYDFGFHPAPTVTSAAFELAIRRDAVPDGVHPLFPNNEIRMLFRETVGGDQLPNLGQEFIYEFTEDVAAIEPIALAKMNPISVRTCAVQCACQWIDGCQPAAAF